MKRLFLISLMIVLVSALILGGCAKPAPAPTPTPTPTPTPAPAPTPAPTPTLVKPIKLRFSTPIPVMSVFHKEIFVPWVEKIKERTTAIGKPVEITIYPAESLAKHSDAYKAVVTGIADIAMWAGLEAPGKFPVAEVMEFAFLFPSATVAALVDQELFDTQAAFRDEFAEAKVLWFQPTPPGQIQARTKQIKTLEDFKGLKFYANSDIDTKVIAALGASPIMMMMPEVYVALERGVLDAAQREWEGTFAWKFFEVTKYRTALPKGFAIGDLVVSMNWDTWKGLPPDVQKIFEETTGPNMTKLCGETMDGANMGLLGMIKEYDQKVGNPEIYNLPQDEFQRWVETVTPVYERWIADREAKGLPGRTIFEDVQRLVGKYSK